MKLNSKENLNKLNSLASVDFDGLSPNMMHNILYFSFTDGALVQLNKDITTETINQIPVFKAVKHFMQILEREKKVKQTQAGYLPPKYVRELYERTELKEDAIIERDVTKLKSEADTSIIFIIRILNKLCGFSKIRNNTLTLTKSGEQSLSDDHKLYFKLMEVLISKLNWGMTDYTQDNGFIQRSVAYTIYLLNKYGNEYKDQKFYYDKFINAFPAALDLFDYHDPAYKERVHWWDYRAKVFELFFTYLGVIEHKVPQSNRRYNDPDEVRKTKILNNIFTIKI